MRASTSEIDQRAKADRRVRLLCQIRGIGRYTAMLIIAEIGEVNRFPTAKHLCQWAGLNPHRPQLRRQSPPWGTSPARGPRSCAGRCAKPLSTPPPAAARSEPNTNGSPNVAAPRSPGSRSPARSSPSATTGCATARSAAWPNRPPMTTSQRPHDSPASLRSPEREVQARASSLLCLVSSTPVNRTTAGLD
jgi:hypothetical protein